MTFPDDCILPKSAVIELDVTMGHVRCWQVTVSSCDAALYEELEA